MRHSYSYCKLCDTGKVTEGSRKMFWRREFMSESCDIRSGAWPALVAPTIIDTSAIDWMVARGPK
jgi:hypothetical protein